jgi:hypothetical protein
MNKTIKILSISKVLKIDIYFMNFIYFSTSFCGIYIIVEVCLKLFGRFRLGHYYVDQDSISFFLYLALAISVPCLLGMLIRYIQLKLLLNNHVLVKGEFRSLHWLDKGYSGIVYYFEYEGKNYYENKYIPKKKFEFPKMRKFKNGDELHFIFNPKNPKRNLILELYDINIDL